MRPLPQLLIILGYVLIANAIGGIFGHAGVWIFYGLTLGFIIVGVAIMRKR